ncbi:MAG TPA: addiction module protein [Thermoanaerobaculia bacterium]|nr:addiction module protein [Thermoanaerobaculia bacterium]
MTENATTLLQQALELPAETRAEIAAELIASLDRETGEEVQRAWAREIQRRVEAVRKGALRGEDWRTVLAEIEREVLSG